MKLTLYGHYLSSSTERVRIALALKGLAHETVSVREISWEAYEKVSPVRLMPAMKVNGEFFTQSNAILHFLEETCPDPPLLPQDPLTRARARARAFGQQIAGDMHPFDVRRVRRFLSNDLSVSREDIDRWQNHWAMLGFSGLEATLKMRDTETRFAFSDQAGWADLHLVPHMRKYVTRFGLDAEKYPLISAIYANCIGLPAFVAAAPASQPDFPGHIKEPEV